MHGQSILVISVVDVGQGFECLVMTRDGLVVHDVKSAHFSDGMPSFGRAFSVAEVDAQAQGIEVA